MPLYQFRCGKCGSVFTSDVRTTYICPLGHTDVKRKYAFTFGVGVREHWNGSVGKYVSNEQHLKDELARAGDKASEETGMHHSYVMADVGEMKQQFGVTDDHD